MLAPYQSFFAPYEWYSVEGLIVFGAKRLPLIWGV